MKRLSRLAAITLVLARCTHMKAEDYLFAYFMEPGSAGVYFALSHDGYRYTQLNDGKPWFRPLQGRNIRDPFLTQGPNGRFRLIWTWDWHGTSLGYAESNDLMHWSEIRELPVMSEFAETDTTWAPEMYWDGKAKQWLVLWSSSTRSDKASHQIWAATTKDFQSFTRPKVWFDPGYPVIDQTLFHNNSRTDLAAWYLIFKDQSVDPLRYQIRVASGPTVEGPWSHISGPITPTWSEGPSVLRVGDRYVVFYDYYRPPARFKAVETTDWQHWTDATPKLGLPNGCKHGSFLRLSSEIAERLVQRHDVDGNTSGAAEH